MIERKDGRNIGKADGDTVCFDPFGNITFGRRFPDFSDIMQSVSAITSSGQL